MWKVILPLILASLVSGCATNGPATSPAPVIINNDCTLFKPIYISKQDKLTEEPGGTADQILAHNQTGAARCGWKLGGKK